MYDTPLSKNASNEIAEKVAAILIDLWPDSNANEYFRSHLVALLQRYPEAIVLKLNDPTSGLPAEYERLPKLATIKKWLDAEFDLLKKREQARAQLADRPRITRSNFFDQALAYGQAKWSANKQPWPSVGPGEPAWQWWCDYFAGIGWFPATWKMIEAGETKEQRFTVPELDPVLFDPEYRPLTHNPAQVEKPYVREDQTREERTEFLNSVLKKYGFGSVGSVPRRI